MYTGVFTLLVLSMAIHILRTDVDAAMGITCPPQTFEAVICPVIPTEEVEYEDPTPVTIGESVQPVKPIKLNRKNEYAPTTPKPAATADVQSYINRFAHVAIAEQKKFGIPASISLAQGIIESKYGTSKLAVENNNHFGIKCHSKSCPNGHCTNHNDDSHKDFFRKFNTAWESWRAHSNVLAHSRYRKHLSKNATYVDWAHALKKGGYATDTNYATTLIGVIKRHNLEKYDKGVIPTKPQQAATVTRSYVLAD
jgi:flagellum-specific peptidoglycan hydrolase FlgJ